MTVSDNFKEVLNALPIAKEHKAIILELVEADTNGESADVAQLEEKITNLTAQVNAIPKYSAATVSNPGLMTGDDKEKLDGLVNYVLPAASTNALGGVKTATNIVDVVAADATTESLAGVVNTILAALRTSGILK